MAVMQLIPAKKKEVWSFVETQTDLLLMLFIVFYELLH